MVRARAWCRVDLAGGTLDIWPLGLLHAGARTVNVAIDIAVEIEMTTRTGGYRVLQDGGRYEASKAEELVASEPVSLVGLIACELDLPPFEVRIASGSPRGGGLGASSALAVALIAAGESITGREASTPRARAALARDLEAMLMSLPTGRQDHFPALLGGVLEVVHAPGGEQVVPIETDLAALGEALMVVFSGQSHFSAGNNWRIVRNRLDSDPVTVRCFEGISAAAAAIVPALRTGDLPRVGALMTEEWRWRRQLADGISTPRIEAILEAAEGAGAWGGKVCGAGGGGCLAVICAPSTRSVVAAAIEAEGGAILETLPVGDPLEIAILDRTEG